MLSQSSVKFLEHISFMVTFCSPQEYGEVFTHTVSYIEETCNLDQDGQPGGMGDGEQGVGDDGLVYEDCVSEFLLYVVVIVIICSYVYVNCPG